MMSTLSSHTCDRRSPVYRQLQQAVSVDFSEQRQKGGLIDLSLMPRMGVRGPGALSWLAQQGLPQPAAANQAATDEQGRWVLRLGQTEHWLLANPWRTDVPLPDISGERCYPVYCEDSRCWFALTGNHRAEVMAKVCAVNLRPEAFALGAVVQTSLARVNAVVVHHQINGQPLFSIFSDSASAEYLWSALLDAMDEFGGAMMSAESLA